MNRSRFAALLSAVMACLFSGCATARLWDAPHFAEYSEPAPDTRLKLSWVPEQTDVLVEYDELPVGKEPVHQRACLLNENEAAVQAAKKPSFITPPPAEKLELLPVYTHPEPRQKPPDPVYAIIYPHGRKFTLVTPENPQGVDHDLPVFCVRSGPHCRFS